MDEFDKGFARIAGQRREHQVFVRSDGNIVEGRDAADLDVAA
jgi:hypothetical protein